MNELNIIKLPSGIEVVDSRQVAEAVGKEHKELLRDIRKYCAYLTESKIALSDFFIKNSYIDSTGRTLPCYNVTKKGCEMIANKMTGQKGVIFTAMYVNAFHYMQKALKNKPIETNKNKLLEIKETNAKVRLSNQFLKLAKVDTLSAEYKNILVAKAAEALTGFQILQLPKSEQKMYSATDIGKMFGVSAQKIGRLSTQYCMKTDEYGHWYRSKSEHSNKEVDTFCYNDKAIKRFEELFESSVIL